MITTPRLRELEEQHRTKLKNDAPIVRLSSKSYIEGYKKALEDLRPVLEAARVLNGFDQYAVPGGSATFKALRDALAGLALEG